MNAKQLTLLLLVLVFMGCSDDDVPVLCQQPEELGGCTELASLSKTQHFDAVIGEWVIIFQEGGLNNTRTVACRDVDGESRRSIRFRSDSTVWYADGDAITPGSWEVVADTSENGTIRTELLLNGVKGDRAFDFICNDGLAYRDERPLDGQYTLFERTE